MKQQTENYIVLKPIAERFNRVAETITDNDIKWIIKEAMREQIKGVFDFERIVEMTEVIIAQNEDDIKDMIYSSIRKRLSV